MIKKRTAILVDGGFFLKRYRSIKKIKNLDPTETANYLWDTYLKYLKKGKQESFDLYRIFYYDCLPYDKR